ncbi:hypothetical protein EON62_04005, partial [archaeon]
MMPGVDADDAGDDAARGVRMKAEGSNTDHNSTRYTILVYDYKKASLLGACANHESLELLATVGDAVARTTLASKTSAAAGAKSPMARKLPPMRPDSSGTPSARDDSERASASEIENATLAALASQVRFSAYLLPAITALTFLDPLPALLSAHDDGSLRMWAMPPSNFPFTCRMYWSVPDAVSLLPPALLGNIVNTLTVAQGATDNAKGRGTQTTRSDVDNVRSSLPALSAAVADYHSVLSRPLDVIDTASALNDSPQSGVHSRVPTALCAFAAGSALPMCMGTLAPEGHARYIQDSVLPPPAPDTLDRMAPPVRAQPRYLISESVAGPGGPLAAAARIMPGEGRTAADMLDAEGAIKFDAYPCADRDGMIVWVGDSDGEVHRWYISPRALARAGLTIIPPVAVDVGSASVCDRRQLHKQVMSLRAVVTALVWSHKQAHMRLHAINEGLRRSAARHQREMGNASAPATLSSREVVVTEVLPPTHQAGVVAAWLA